jgi:DNA-binding transcriptional regulator YiaG
MGRRRVRWNARSVRELRSRLGLTQQALADELGARQATVSDWERGVYTPRGPSASMLAVIAERAGFRYGEESDDDGAPT